MKGMVLEQAQEKFVNECCMRARKGHLKQLKVLMEKADDNLDAIFPYAEDVELMLAVRLCPARRF